MGWGGLCGMGGGSPSPSGVHPGSQQPRFFPRHGGKLRRHAPHPCGLMVHQAPSLPGGRGERPPGLREPRGWTPGAPVGLGMGGWVPSRLHPSLPPRWFFHSKLRAVTHAVKILPSPGNHKPKMRLDSCALRGSPGGGGCRMDTPGEGAGNSPRVMAKRGWGLTEHPNTGRDAAPHPSTAAHRQHPSR